MCDRICTRCRECKPVEYFNRDRTRTDGVYPQCKDCSRRAARCSYETHLAEHRALKQVWKDMNRERHREINRAWRQVNLEKARRYTAGHKAALQAATPPWVDRAAIRRLYKQRPQGYHIDHIEPLQGRDRCGLNVPWSLQYLPAEVSFRKGNRTDGEVSYSGRL